MIQAHFMEIPEFPSVDTLRKLWWLHDSFWHAALVKELGFEQANRINLEVAERLFRMMTNQLLRERVIERPRSIQDLLAIFKVVWKNAFFDALYINDPIHFNGNTGVWIGSKCYVYEAVKKARMLEGYDCGCQAVRNGVMRALRLQPLHEIKESLVRGDGRCVIEITFAPAP
ncbi:MAG: hypothetical protein A2Y65_04155 [Deltaproteobacteria bacterium RBG_13_52_11]|nr:MAG: hypothetical protein A2Y65_04155 [Deltaproteobacteria bacterium RBG_13_52_11]